MAITRLFLAVLRGFVLCGVSLVATHVWAFELTLTETLVDQAAHLIYNPVSGNIIAHSPGDPLTSIQIESRSSAFYPEGGPGIVFPYPCDLPCILDFKASYFDFDGFDTFDFGGLEDVPVLARNLTAEWIIADIAVDGSRLAGGKINVSPGGGPYLLIVPEPSGILLACYGMLGLSVGRLRLAVHRESSTTRNCRPYVNGGRWVVFTCDRREQFVRTTSQFMYQVH